MGRNHHWLLHLRSPIGCSLSHRVKGVPTLKSKYKNVKTVYNGQIFDSKLEARYCQELDMKLKAGIILNYERQVRFPLTVNDQLICTYIADFVVEYPTLTAFPRIEVVDTKGVKTQIYRIKKKLLKAITGITIIEISA